MKFKKVFNPIEWLGIITVAAGYAWSWAKHGPAGLPLIEYGIFLIFLGALCVGLFERKK